VTRLGEERKVYKVSVGRPKERSHSEDRDVDGRMGAEYILVRLANGGGGGGVELVQDRNRWRAIVNVVTNLRFLAPQSYVISYKLLYKYAVLNIHQNSRMFETK
jgi:hypothetical protein